VRKERVWVGRSRWGIVFLTARSRDRDGDRRGGAVAGRSAQELLCSVALVTEWIGHFSRGSNVCRLFFLKKKAFGGQLLIKAEIILGYQFYRKHNQTFTR
jgi:hypothetical protein